jgi:hypothetical protein
MSLDVSNFDNEPLSHCSPKVEIYIKGAVVDNTRHIRGGWIDLIVDCEGVLWMSNLVAIWKYDPRTMYNDGEDTRVAVVSTDQFGCGNTMTLTDCQVSAITEHLLIALTDCLIVIAITDCLNRRSEGLHWMTQ